MIQRFFKSILLVFLLATTAPAWSQEAIEISNAWAPPTHAGQDVAAVFLTLKANQDASLVKIETPAAGSVEIHQMSMDKGIMKMRKIDSFALLANHSYTFSPEEFHLMLFDLKKPLEIGKNIDLTLHLKTKSGDSLSVKTSAKITEK
jgi:periplasmic copper chaperone A